MERGWDGAREGEGFREGGSTRRGVWFIFFNFMPPLPPMLADTSLWICGLLAKPTASTSEPRSWPTGHSLVLKTGFCDFFLNLNHCVWYFSDKIKKRKKNPSWANVKFFVSPFTSIVS